MAIDVEIIIQNGRFYFTCPGGIGDEPPTYAGMCSVPATRDEPKKGQWKITTPAGEKQTLNPSIRCHRCGWHGCIKKGQMDAQRDSKIQL